MRSNFKLRTVAGMLLITAAGTANEPTKDIFKNDAGAECYPFNIHKHENATSNVGVNPSPVFRKVGNRLYMTLLNLNANTVDIKVLDSDNRILFKEAIEGEVTVTKAFNFEDAYEDTYKIVVSNTDEVYYKYVTIN